jgi:hypothetical protein
MDWLFGNLGKVGSAIGGAVSSIFKPNLSFPSSGASASDVFLPQTTASQPGQFTERFGATSGSTTPQTSLPSSYAAPLISSTVKNYPGTNLPASGSSLGTGTTAPSVRPIIPATHITPITTAPPPTPFNAQPSYDYGNTGSTTPYAPLNFNAAPSYQPQGTSGAAGQSYASNPGYYSAPSQGASGDSGTAGGSNFTGNLGAAGGLGTPSISSPEETNKKKTLANQQNPAYLQAPTQIPMSPFGGLPAGFTPAQTPQGGTAYRDASGNLYIPQALQSGGQVLQLAPNTLAGNQAPQVGGGISGANPGQVQVQPSYQRPQPQFGGPSSTFSAGAAPKTLDMAAKTAAEKITAMLKDPKFAADGEGALKAFNDIYEAERQKLDLENPVPPGGVVNETPDQQAWLEQQDPSQAQNLRAYMDTKRQELGLPDLEMQKIQAMKDLKATDAAFQKIIKDIEDNPDLPKGLAAKRIREFTDKNGLTIKNLQNQLEIINTQIKDANDSLDREFNIRKAEEDSYYKQQALAINQQQASKLDTQIVEVGGRRQLVNTQTGELVADLGSSTSPKSTTDTQVKTVTSFNSALVDRAKLDNAGNREQFIRQLTAQFPSIEPGDIARKVYETYPDNYQRAK